ncbi:hypothetical protein QR680_000149 [Steinernema hermaphroditum]|uniref:Ubiquitin-conjugating enzyme E2 J2 n=1 Tax=Steinernema hermaphroditum TaxID=289476 RepID=A0AA39LDT1_9BILA|nr:hypothetical protein QR680_000149 [Steinernema hermaphroditum]
MSKNADPVPYVRAVPLPSNILEWHYVVEGSPDTPYEGGFYHGKLVFPADFPFKPPSIYMITPSGRFQTNTRLCLSISDYHPDTWNPAWTVSTIINGLLSFMNENTPTLGCVNTTESEKRILAKKSRAFNLANRTFCDLFDDLSKELRAQLEEEALNAPQLATEESKPDERSRRADGLDGMASLAYNVIVVAGVVLLALAVKAIYGLMLSRRQFFIIFLVLVLAFCSVLYLLVNNLVQTPTIHRGSRCVDAVTAERPHRFTPTYLLIIVMSHSNDSSTRSVIRDTWLRLSAKGPSQVRHLFSIGTKGLSDIELKKLYDEQEQYDDLLLLASHVDTYENLARKTARSFKTAIEEVNFEFVLKVDSDSFVRLGSFLKALKDIANPMLYWGFLDGRAKPFRKGKWKEKDWILCDRYLPYQLGGGYVLSYRLANYIATNADLLKYYRSEDVSVGAWLAGLDVKYVHDPRFDTEFRSRGCSNQYLITHKQSVTALRQLFTNVRDLGQLCTKEVQLRASYVYDWSALPSQCCTRANNTHIP